MPFSAELITLVGVCLANCGFLAKTMYDGRKNGKNGNNKPCPLHEGLANEIRTLHSENREDHKQIFKDINDLSKAVAGAAAAAASAAAAALTATQKIDN
jgi:hypothetical protein